MSREWFFLIMEAALDRFFSKVLALLFLLVVFPLRGAVGVTVSPMTATVKQGATQTFKATVTGSTNTAVTWTTTGGSITTAGVLTAPGLAGSYTVTATSKADTTKKAAATVTVPVVGITVSPTTAIVNQGGTKTFTATVTGAANTGVTWATAGGRGSVRSRQG